MGLPVSSQLRQQRVSLRLRQFEAREKRENSARLVDRHARPVDQKRQRHENFQTVLTLAVADAVDRRQIGRIRSVEDKDRINELLSEFGASFQLGDITPQYVGGQASSTFDIVIKNHRVAVGDPADPRGQPRFGCTLSSGDRSTLALAFFLAQLEQDPSYKDAVVIFDDPFTSQDRFRRTRTQQLISDKARDCKQIVVMSHDPHFLKLIWDNHESASTRTLQISRMRRDEATIAEWDIEAATRSGYAQDYFDLQAYVHRSQGQPKDVARKIRPVLEGYLRVRFPAEFPEGQWLGQLIDKIRSAPVGSPLESMHGQPLQELANINDFSKSFHHETNPSGYDTAVLNEDELTNFCEKTIRYIGGF